MLKNALAPPPTLGAFLAGDLGFLYQYQSGKPMILSSVATLLISFS
jgi:hypothetical protein